MAPVSSAAAGAGRWPDLHSRLPAGRGLGQRLPGTGPGGGYSGGSAALQVRILWRSPRGGLGNRLPSVPGADRVIPARYLSGPTNSETGAMDSETTVLATHELTKRFGQLMAVDQLSLEGKRGEIFGFFA